MRTHACISAFIVVVLIQGIYARRRQIWDTSEDDTSPLPPPTFRNTPTRVTFREGQMAKLECSLDHLGTKKIIWRRKSDPNPLTIGRRTFVDDARISVEHVPLGPDWHLIIKQVRRDDEGVYECQISSKDRDLRRYVHLSVKPGKRKQKIKTESDNPPPPEISITGATYVEKGHKIRLVCNATGGAHSPDELDWYFEGQKLITDVDEKVTIQKRVSLMEKTIYSVLEVEKAEMEDAGIYICRTSPELQVEKVRVDVLNADTNNVKRGTEKDTSANKSDGSQSRQGRYNQGGADNLAPRHKSTNSNMLMAVMLTVLLTKFQLYTFLPT